MNGQVPARSVRLHENLPAVEAATERYVERKFPLARRRARVGTKDHED
jgi:hypothetical protein